MDWRSPPSTPTTPCSSYQLSMLAGTSDPFAELALHPDGPPAVAAPGGLGPPAGGGSDALSAGWAASAREMPWLPDEAVECMGLRRARLLEPLGEREMKGLLESCRLMSDRTYSAQYLDSLSKAVS